MRTIAEDRAGGAVPAMVVATAGTTGAGMIDPLHACADIAKQEHLWYHIDAAWGGAVLASNRLRPLLAGIERADSITIDAHKWLATTMGCAIFITRHADLLSEAFSCLDQLHAVECPRASTPTSAACNGRAASWDCVCFWHWPPPAGKVLERMWERGAMVVESSQGRAGSPGMDGRQRVRAGGARCGTAGRTRRRTGPGAPRGGLRPRLGSAHHVRGPRRGGGFCATNGGNHPSRT